MGDPVRVVSVLATVDVNVPTTVETVIATVSGISTRDQSEQVVITAIVQFLTGAATTAVTLRVRRGVDTTGVLVGEANPIAAAAAAAVGLAVAARDNPGYVAGQSYVITAQQTAATAAGTAQQSGVTALVGG